MRLLYIGILWSPVLLAAAAEAASRFLAIPLEDVVELSERGLRLPIPVRTRLPRTPSPIGRDTAASGVDVDVASTRPERHTLGHAARPTREYVDFGAHTGHHGSFGWYADFPAYKAS